MKTFHANNHLNDNVDHRNIHGTHLRKALARTHGLPRILQGQTLVTLLTSDEPKLAPAQGIIYALCLVSVVYGAIMLAVHWNACASFLGALWSYVGTWLGRQNPANLLLGILGIVGAGAVVMGRGK